LPGQPDAALAGVCRLCPASRPPYPDVATDPTGPGPTLDGDPHSLQSGCPGQTVQGSYPPPPPEFLPRQSAATPCDGFALSRPTPRRQHVVIGAVSLASPDYTPSQRLQDASQRCRDIPEGDGMSISGWLSLLAPQRPWVWRGERLTSPLPYA